MSTYSEIYNNILSLKDDNGVALFDSSSLTAIFDAISRTVAVNIDNTILEINNTKNIIDNNILTKNYGRYWYYVGKALLYQDGDNLIEDLSTHEFYYENVDITKQIIKQAAFEDSLNAYSQLKLKVATIDLVSGDLVKLSNSQKAAFDTYMRNYEIPGLPLTKLSLDPAILNFDVSIQFSANYDLNTILANVETYCDLFRKTFSFNGVFYKNGIYGLENYIVNNVQGIIDFSLSNMTITEDSLTTSFQIYTSLKSGYFNFDPSFYLKIQDSSNYISI